MAIRSLEHFVTYTMPDFVVEDYHRKLFDALERVERGELKRLMVFMPPRAGKSEIISKRFPAWCLGRNSKKLIVNTSYGADLANELGRKAKNITLDQGFKNVFPNFKIADDKREGGNWETTDGGGYYSVGVGGALTGRGFDCLPSGTLIATEHGEIPIDDLAIKSTSCKILAYDQSSKSIVFKNLQAIGMRTETRLYRITTTAGRVVEATGNHPFFTQSGYTEASKLTAGDSLLCRVRRREDQNSIRDKQVGKERSNGAFLLKQMLGNTSEQKSSRGEIVQELQEANARDPWSILFKEMQKRMVKHNVSRVSDEEGENKTMSPMRYVIRQAQELANLFKGMFGTSPQCKDDRKKQSDIQTRWEWKIWKPSQLGTIQGLETEGNGERWAFVRDMRSDKRTSCASCGFEPIPQCGNKSCDTLLSTPYDPAQCRESTESDTVALVEELCRESIVFNISVADCENYFANGVLVHNCGIIDDPVKNREDAESQTIRTKTWEWYTSTFYTRQQGSTAAIVILMTRWSSDDLAGRILELHQDDWEIISFPAIKDGVPLSSRPGFGLEFYEAQREAIGVRDFEALYQQDPIKASGQIFKKQDFRYFNMSDLNPQDFTFAVSVDPAWSTREGSDDVAIAVTARHKATREIYVLDVFAEPTLPSETYAYVLSLCEKWKMNWTMEFLSAEEVNLSKDQTRFVNEMSSYLRQSGKFYNIIPFTPKGMGKKEDRIKYALQPYFNRHAIYFRGDDGANRTWQKLETQLLKFPANPHEDILDSVAQAVSMWETIGGNPSGSKMSFPGLYSGMGV